MDEEKREAVECKIGDVVEYSVNKYPRTVNVKEQELFEDFGNTGMIEVTSFLETRDIKYAIGTCFGFESCINNECAIPHFKENPLHGVVITKPIEIKVPCDSIVKVLTKEEINDFYIQGLLGTVRRMARVLDKNNKAIDCEFEKFNRRYDRFCDSVKQKVADICCILEEFTAFKKDLSRGDYGLVGKILRIVCEWKR